MYLFKRTKSPFWQACIEVDGRERKISTGHRNRGKAEQAALAREMQENALIESATGEDSVAFSAAAERVLRSKDLKPSTVQNYTSCFTNIYGVLGDFPLGTLSISMVRNYIAKRLEKADCHVAVRRDLEFLSTVWTRAKGWDTSLGDNPMFKFKRNDILRRVPERNTPVMPYQAERLLAACTAEYQRTAIILMIESGMRSGEVMQLRWDQVDMKRRIINLEAKQTKTNEGRFIPILDRSFGALHCTLTAQCGEHEFVFPGRAPGTHQTTFKTFWQAARRRANLPGVRIHDLRHTFASTGKRSGMEDSALQTLMGHKTASMTKRYSKHSEDSLRTAMKSFHYALDYTQPSGNHDPEASA